MESFDEGRNAGVATHGRRGDKLNWGFGAFYEADDFGKIVDDDRVNITGRAVFRPLYEDGGKRLVHVGLGISEKAIENQGAARFRSRSEAHFYGRLVDTSSLPVNGVFLTGLELATVVGRFWAAAELIQAEVDAPLLGDPTIGGFYAQVGYYLTDDHRRYKTSSGTFDRQKPNSVWDKSGGSGAWEIAFRWSSLDLNDSGFTGGSQDNLTLGVNWYPNPATRVMLNWVHATAELQSLANEVGGDFVVVRFQVDF